MYTLTCYKHQRVIPINVPMAAWWLLCILQAVACLLLPYISSYINLWASYILINNWKPLPGQSEKQKGHLEEKKKAKRSVNNAVGWSIQAF